MHQRACARETEHGAVWMAACRENGRKENRVRSEIACAHKGLRSVRGDRQNGAAVLAPEPRPRRWAACRGIFGKMQTIGADGCCKTPIAGDDEHQPARTGLPGKRMGETLAIGCVVMAEDDPRAWRKRRDGAVEITHTRRIRHEPHGGNVARFELTRSVC